MTAKPLASFQIHVITHKRITYYPAMAVVILLSLICGRWVMPTWVLMYLLFRLELQVGPPPQNWFSRYLTRKALRSQLRALNRVIMSSPDYYTRTWCRDQANLLRVELYRAMRP